MRALLRKLARLRAKRYRFVLAAATIFFILFSNFPAIQQHVIPILALHPGHIGSSAQDVDASMPSKVLTFIRRNVLNYESEARPRSPRVLCWILTSPANLLERTQLIKRTWGPRCDITLYMSSKENKAFPTIGLGTQDGNKTFNSQKAIKAWTYIYNNYRNKADFFFKADDDTYAIIENLRLYLSEKDPEAAEFYGHRFYMKTRKLMYMSGGAGFVLTRRALDLLVNEFRKNPTCIPPGPGEDWKTARCLASARAKAVDTRDKFGRERFLVSQPKTHLLGVYPDWYTKYDVDGSVKGHKCCSYYPISFHYVRDNEMLVLEWLFYHSRVYQLAENPNNVEDFVQLDSLYTKNKTHEVKTNSTPNFPSSDVYGTIQELKTIKLQTLLQGNK